MSRDDHNNLPSYRDFMENPDDLPSVEEFKEENLPSVEDFLEKTVEEETQTIENSDGESFLEVTDVVQAPEWSELVRLVNDVRKDIPKVPEIRYYDEQLEEICAQIAQIQDNYAKRDKIDVLSVQNEEFEGKLFEIESKIPTVKYYDHDINSIYDKITDIKEEIKSLPEVKYYEEDLESLKSRIEQVNEAIPTFPDWIQEVQEVPDFSWIGKTFSLIDDDFNKVQGHIDVIKEKIDREVNELNESLEVKEFEFKVDVKNLSDNLDQTNDRITETKDKIYQEIKEASIRIWELRNTFKDDDRKLKKSVLSEQNKLKQSLETQIKEINEQSVKTDESILKFFTDLKETVDTLPEVKYYDEDVSRIDSDILSLRKELKELTELASLIKTEQTELKENYLLNEPPEEKERASGQVDPLTPIDQNFATLEDLSNHYRLFLARITTQLSTMGGGGAGFIKDLDDVEFDGTTGEGKLLIYDQSRSKWVGIASTAIQGSAGIAQTSFISGIAITMTTGNFTNVNVAGTITYDDVQNVDSIGLVTARSGIRIGTGGTVGPVGSGIVTYYGDGSKLTGIIGGVGIQSGSVRIGTGFTDINFTGAGVSSVVGAGNTVTIDIPATTIRRQVETASGITTDFTITNGYTAGFIDVFLNGVKQRSGTDFTASDGTTVTMVPYINNGDVLEFQIVENLTIASQNNPTGAGGTWAVDTIGINTTKSVGIGTTAKDGYSLFVQGNARVTGILTVGEGSITLDPNAKKISGVDEIIIGTGTTITSSGDAEYVGVVTARNVSIGNTFTYPEYITGGMVPRAIKSQGGYERTLRFVDHQTQTEASQDPSDYIEYTQELASSGTWKRLGITTSGNSGRDNDWWGETNPNYDNTKGLFGGLTNPAGVDKFFDFDDNTAFNNAKTTGSLKYSQAVGSFSLKDCQVGDLVLARFDLNIMPMVTNTTVEIALIYANRNSSDTITNEFALTHTPLAYGSGTVGKGFLLRPTISAYIANDQDINSRSLLAIKADNPVLINPIGVLFTIQR